MGRGLLQSLACLQPSHGASGPCWHSTALPGLATRALPDQGQVSLLASTGTHPHIHPVHMEAHLL